MKKADLLQEIDKKYGGDTDKLLADLESHRPKSKSAKKGSKAGSNPVLASLESVSKTYKTGRNNVEAVRDVSFDIKEGEIVALVGPSGSGKSSILNIIGGLDRPTKGKVSVAGDSLAELSDGKLSEFRNKTIGFVFQFFYLQPFLDLQTNVEIPMMFNRAKKTERRKQSTSFIDAVGLGDRADHKPNELSGGQIQRTAIARALVNNPKLVLADEPTGNLDRKNGDQIMDLFEEIREKYNTAVLLITHDEKTAARADRIIELEDGKIV